MTHYRNLYDTDYIGVWSLGGEDRTVVIKRVKGGEVGGQDGRKKQRKILVFFEQFEKAMVLNVTNAKTIAGMYGNDVRGWLNKRVTLYATTTKFSGEVVDCIRIRPTIPTGETSENQPDRPMDPETRARQDRAAKESE